MNWQDMFTPETATPEDEALEAQYNKEYDLIRRAEEAERELADLRERIANLALEGALVDGERRKQGYLERIMVECGAPVQAWHKRHQWQVGIAP